MKRTVTSLSSLLLVTSALAGCGSEAPPHAEAPSTAAPSGETHKPDSNAPATPSKEDTLASRLDAVLDAATNNGPIVGTVVMVARDGKIVYRRAVGFADREAKRPVREDTIFRLASMSKPIVSAAALALVDQGKLALEDPVTKYLPTFRPKLADGRTPAITVRQLITHTAGLGYVFDEPENGPYHRANVSTGLDQPGLSLEENLTRIAKAPLPYEPGKAWHYSLSIDVLGGVVAKAGGGTLQDVVKRLVTGPLGIDANTAFTVPDKERLASPYADGTPPIRMTDVYNMQGQQGPMPFAIQRVFDPKSYPSGGAGMVGTAEDYVRFLEAVRTGDKILRKETAGSMVTNQLGDMKVEQPGGEWGFGFGFAVLKKPDPKTMPSREGTFQWGGAYGNNFWVDPAEKLTVVVLTNTAFAGMAGAFPDAVRKAVYGRSPAP